MASDPDAYDCRACEYRVKQETLTTLDQDCLELYRLLSNRAVKDLRLTPMVFDILGLKMTRAEGVEVLNKLGVIHDAMSPAGDSSFDPFKDDDD